MCIKVHLKVLRGTWQMWVQYCGTEGRLAQMFRGARCLSPSLPIAQKKIRVSSIHPASSQGCELVLGRWFHGSAVSREQDQPLPSSNAKHLPQQARVPPAAILAGTWTSHP